VQRSLWLKLLTVTAVLLLLAASGATEERRAAAPAAPAPESKAAPQTGRKTHSEAERIDINTATKAQLMNLPGVGEATARQIIMDRPYAKKDQLKTKKILTAQQYDRIKELIIARQPVRKKPPHKY